MAKRVFSVVVRKAINCIAVADHHHHQLNSHASAVLVALIKINKGCDWECIAQLSPPSFTYTLVGWWMVHVVWLGLRKGARQMFPSRSGLQFNAHQNYSALISSRSVQSIIHMARRGKTLLKAVLLRPNKGVLKQHLTEQILCVDFRTRELLDLYWPHDYCLTRTNRESHRI